MKTTRENGELDASGSRRAESIPVRRFAVYTLILTVAALATAYLLFHVQKDQAERVVRASELAQERLDRFVAQEKALDASAVSVPAAEEIISLETGERYSSEVAIDTMTDGTGPERVTVTVGWETITGRAKVRMHRVIDTPDLKEALSH
ncbi:MAG: hypothetical protein ABR899_09390 [Candidatus Krumholzibacteriaceae bacterium]|jgi:hypothetical protein